MEKLSLVLYVQATENPHFNEVMKSHYPEDFKIPDVMSSKEDKEKYCWIYLGWVIGLQEESREIK